jgi:TldD protein
MLDRLKAILSRVPADYADLRYEVKKDTLVEFAGRDLANVGSSTADGFVLRVLHAGGLASVAFTREADADRALRRCLEDARTVGALTATPMRLAPSPAETAVFHPTLREDPRTVPLEEKIELTRRYNAIPLSRPRVATTTMTYKEVIRDKFFASSEGAAINETLVTSEIRGLITTCAGALLQNVRVNAGGSDGFARLRGREDVFDFKTALAEQLLEAAPACGGVYNVVLNPMLAGVFVHEAFGHFSEADEVEDAPSIRERMRLGAELGDHKLDIWDDPTRPGLLGHYRFDDEGVRARPVLLMKDGVLRGRLHCRRTAAAFAEPVTGHCVAEDYRYAPVVRMGAIFIAPGHDDLDALFAKAEDGLYICDAKGGETVGEAFTFAGQYAYLIRGGRKAGMIRDVNISGNLYETLRRICAVGSDLSFNEAGGACGKGRQLNIRSCLGGPHILIEGAVVGGA